MNFLGMGPGELMVIMVLALIVFGPQKLPEIGQGLGKAIGEFRRATSQITDEINRELSLEAPPKPQAPATPVVPAPAPVSPAAPVETTVSGQAQADGPLVLEIKPPAASATFEAAPLNEAAPVPPVAAQPESPTAVDGIVEVPHSAPNAAARAARARQARKAVSSSSQESEPMSEEASEAVNS